MKEISISLRFTITFVLFISGSTFCWGKQYNDTVYISALIQEGRNLLTQSQWDSAQTIFIDVLNRSNTIKYYDGAIIALGSIGQCVATKNNSLEALVWYKKGLDLYQKHKASPAAIRSIFGGLGIQYAQLGIYDSSYHYFIEGLKEAELSEIKDYEIIANFYSNISAYWLNRHDTKKALNYIDKGIAIAHKIRDSVSFKNLMYGLLINKGAVFANQLYQMDSAIYYYQLVIKQSAHNDRSTVRAIQNISLVYHKAKQYARALPYIQKAYELSKTINDQNDILTTQFILGSTYYHLKRYPEAEFHLLAALKSNNQVLQNKDYLTALIDLSALYAEQGVYNKAHKFLEEAYQLNSDIFSEQSAKNINELDIKYRTAEKDKEIAQKALEITRQQSAIKEKNLLIGGVTVSAVFLAAFLIVVTRNYKTRKRMFSKQILMLHQEKELESLKSMMRGEEQERGRLARDIHDGVGGMLAAIKMNVSAIQDKPISEQRPEDLNMVMEMIETTANEVRKTAHNLMPDLLIQYNLAEALRIYCDTINSKDSLQIDLQFHSEWESPDKKFELSVYRILQEIIQNTLKHARAANLIIQFRCLDNILHITVEDDGKGFDTQQVSKGVGLNNIHARLKLLHGNASVESTPGKGTTCYLDFNLEEYKKTL